MCQQCQKPTFTCMDCGKPDEFGLCEDCSRAWSVDGLTPVQRITISQMVDRKSTPRDVVD